jgi:hypothetical protein
MASTKYAVNPKKTITIATFLNIYRLELIKQ